MDPHGTLVRPDSGRPPSARARRYRRLGAVLAGAVLAAIALTGAVIDFRDDDRVRHERIAELLHPPYDGS